MILSNSSWTINSDQECKRWTSISILDVLEHLTAMIIVNATIKLFFSLGQNQSKWSDVMYICNPQRIWNYFCGISSLTKNTWATLRAQVTWASKIWLWIFNACFTQITSFKFKHSFGFDWFSFFSVSSISFDCRIQSNSIRELFQNKPMNWVQLSSIGFD